MKALYVVIQVFGTKPNANISTQTFSNKKKAHKWYNALAREHIIDTSLTLVEIPLWRMTCLSPKLVFNDLF